ncbi:MAG: M15 family metallopeptidase [Clostridiales Family XIII bacterium]|jgi:D-alanyl-D-alanine carboxypeptidase|nr:M15 family metallopeptidase [Clostridiales Family XIII bacterium]
MNAGIEREKRKRKNSMRTAMSLIVTAAVVCAITAAIVFAAIWGVRAIGARMERASGGANAEADASENPPRGEEATETEAGAPPSEHAHFLDLYYCEEDRLERYLDYEAAHPELSPEEVVWRVDVDIDKPFYENAVELELECARSEQALVSKRFKLPDDFEPAELAQIDGDYRVTPATKEAYERLREGAKAAGHSIRAASAYRTIEYQKNLYARYLNEDPNNADNYSARPGFSEHHTGRAIDLVGPSGTLRGFVGTKEAEWVRENAWNYGFIVRYTPENEEITGYESEPWHITYIGREAAALMRENGIGSLEEYVAKYVLHLPPQ